MFEQKSAARKSAFEKRKLAHAAGGDDSANQNLMALMAQYPEAKVVAGYLPMRTEINPLSTMTLLHAQSIRICVPVIQRKGLPLLFQEWTPGGELQPSTFGTSVPKSGTMLEPDLLITPLLAFDQKGFRLGYGAGFYDRTLERLRANGRGIAIGFAYAAQEFDVVPNEATDQRLDAIVTEAGITRFDR